MREGRIEIDLDEGCIDALAVCADDVGRCPPVILLADRGADAQSTLATARRLAGYGFFVLAPQSPDDPVEEAFDAWLDYLAAERLTDDTRVGVLGYGAGADLGLQLAAARGERVAALAMFHPEPLPEQDIHHVAGCLNAVIHLGYAGHDRSWGADDAAALEQELRRADVDFEVEVYPAASGFAAPEGANHDPQVAELHWERLVELFRRTLPPAHAPGQAELAAPHL